MTYFRERVIIFVEELKVDVLMNNAGVMGLPERKTVDGFESQFAINVLGTCNPMPAFATLVSYRMC